VSIIKAAFEVMYGMRLPPGNKPDIVRDIDDQWDGRALESGVVVATK
jgi:hypothetical protein